MTKHILRFLFPVLLASFTSSCIIMSDNDFGELFRPSIQNAAMDGNINEVQGFLKQGVDVNAVDKEGDSALIIAARWGYLELVSVLLDEGADPNQRNVALESAIGEVQLFDREDDLRIVQQLIEAGADIDNQDEDGYTSLHLLAFHGHKQAPDIARYFLAHGANPDTLNEIGQDALMVALDNRGKETTSDQLIQLLIEQISDSDLQDEDGWTYLDFLCDGNASPQSYDLGLGKLLISAGNTVGEDTINDCENNGQHDLAAYLSE